MVRNRSSAAVCTRLLESTDAVAVGRMAHRCSRASLRRRFLGWRPTGSLAEPIRAGSPVGRVDVGAFAGGVLVGVASLIPYEDEWEAAMLVEDAWQGHGVGSRLADELVAMSLREQRWPVNVYYLTGGVAAARLVGARGRDIAAASWDAGVIQRRVVPVGDRA